MVIIGFVDVEHNWTNQCTTFLMNLLTFTLWISFAQETRSSILVLRFFSHYWCSEKLQRDRVPAWADFFFFLILVSCWCNGLDQSYMENGFLCLLALALRFRVSACMYVTLSHYRGEFRVWHFFCFFYYGVYMHKNPAYEPIKLSLSLCLWIPNTTTACWFVLHMQTILTGWVSSEGSTHFLP